MESLEIWRRSLESIGSDMDSNAGTVILYPSDSSDGEQESSTDFGSIASDSGYDPYIFRSQEPKTTRRRILDAVFNVNPSPRVPSRKQLAKKFWDERFQRNENYEQDLKDRDAWYNGTPQIQNRKDNAQPSKNDEKDKSPNEDGKEGENPQNQDGKDEEPENQDGKDDEQPQEENVEEKIDDDEAMRRPIPRGVRLRPWERKPRAVKMAQIFAPRDKEGLKYWFIDHKGKSVKCLCRCLEGFLGEIRVYTFFGLSIAYAGLWVLVYTLYGTMWYTRVKPFPIGTWPETRTYAFGGPTVIHTTTGHIVTFKHDPKTITTTADFTIITTPAITVWAP
ncbi:hypothetical protein TWF481_009225 [Arthrobotrys musiformis]|uniref:Uncharacterized protein n=1 Tax=Arthrobotrys musiformis TaxID=47236 RepID=A0AAV9W546_9PEZI